MHLEHIALIGEDYDAAIQFFVGKLGFELLEGLAGLHTRRPAQALGRYERMQERGVEFVSDPRTEAYGQVAVFLDISGNRWDLLGPLPTEDR